MKSTDGDGIDICVLDSGSGGDATTTSAASATLFTNSWANTFQPKDLLAQFGEEDDAIDIDDEDGNWPDLEGSDRNDDPQKKTAKGNSNKRKSTEPLNGIQQTYV